MVIMTEKNLEIINYIQQTSKVIDLSISSEYLPGVVENFSRLKAMASLVTDFPLSQDIETATQFEP